MVIDKYVKFGPYGEKGQFLHSMDRSDKELEKKKTNVTNLQ